MDSDENLQISSGNSSDENLAEELSKAGINVTRKRKTNYRKVTKCAETSKLDAAKRSKMHKITPRKPQAASRTKAHSPNQQDLNPKAKIKSSGSTQNIDFVDIRKQPLIEEVNGQYINLNTKIQQKQSISKKQSYTRKEFKIPARDSVVFVPTAPANILPIQTTTEPHDYPVMIPLIDAQFDKLIEVPTNNKHKSSPDSPSTHKVANLCSADSCEVSDAHPQCLSLIRAPDSNLDTLAPNVLVLHTLTEHQDTRSVVSSNANLAPPCSVTNNLYDGPIFNRLCTQFSEIAEVIEITTVYELDSSLDTSKSVSLLTTDARTEPPTFKEVIEDELSKNGSDNLCETSDVHPQSPSCIQGPDLNPDVLPLHAPSLILTSANTPPNISSRAPFAPLSLEEESAVISVFREASDMPPQSPSLIEAHDIQGPDLNPDVLPLHPPSLLLTSSANTPPDISSQAPYAPHSLEEESAIIPVFREASDVRPQSPSLIEAHGMNRDNPNPETSTPTLRETLAVNQDSQLNVSSGASLAPPRLGEESVESAEESTFHGDMTQNKKRKSKACVDPKLWKRNDNKEKRAKGESYLGYRRDYGNGTKFKVKHDVYKPARSMGPSCTSSFCVKSKLRACDTINYDARQQLFKTFWKNFSWDQRRAYICSHVMKNEKKVTKNPASKRTESRAYYLTIDNNRYQVCKQMFLGTLGIKEWFVRYWLSKTDCAMPPDTCESQKGKKGPEKTACKEYLITFFSKLPKMPSHYCRESTSKLYLEPLFGSMSELYKVYKNACEVDSQQCLGIKLFCSIFEQQNLALYHPKKDQCDLCCSYKVGNLSEEDYNRHITNKNRARAEKSTDKLFAQSGTCHVFTQDVESVKLLPYLQASAIYYKTKLFIHNFTIYNLANKDVFCYWFDESNSTLEASVFASCLVEFLSKTLEEKSLPIILYSDGCCAQNRNATLSNALLRLAIEKKVVITQKYLEKGHTQMECDSVHSAIECKVKGKEIFLPEQYVQLTKKARMCPKLYESKLLDFSFFIDFSKDLIYKSIRPGKKKGDPVVTDLRVLEYSPDGTIKYKICFDDDLRPLPLRPLPLHRIKPINELPKLFSERLPIASRKFHDLQDLKAVIPESCHDFYDQLPHTPTSTE